MGHGALADTSHGQGTLVSIDPRPEVQPLRSFSIVCLSSQEWAAPLPTNRQQIMRRAAEQGHSVLFVETGEFIGRHLVRLIVRRERTSLVRRLTVGEQVAPRLTVRKGVNLLPWGQRYSFSDRANGWVTRHILGVAARRLPGPRVTWLYDPRATWAIGAVGDSFGVYDCVDDYAEQASRTRNRTLLAAADRRAASSVRLVFATTNALRNRHLSSNRKTFLVRNVGDFDHFAEAACRDLVAPELAALRRPVLGFIGNLTERKVDVSLLRALAERSRGSTILLAGPVDSAIADEIASLARRENVVCIGPVPYERAPQIVAAFDVGLIPYCENGYTRNVFPLKLYEYLAAGKPVVATGVPEIAGLEPDAVLVHGPDEVERAISMALSLTSKEDVERRQGLAAANTWETRTGQLLDLVAGELDE